MNRTGGQCASCGARVVDVNFCTACGAPVARATASDTPAIGAPSVSGREVAGVRSNRRRQTGLVAGAAVAALILLGGAIFVVFGLGGASSKQVSAATSSTPSEAPQPNGASAHFTPSATPSPVPETTVTATATAAPPPGPTTTVTATVTAPPVAAQPDPTYSAEVAAPAKQPRYAPTFSSFDFGYQWRGSVAGSEDGKPVTYYSTLSLSQDSSGYVTGTAVLTSSGGNAGQYTVSGQVHGNTLVLNPGSWINKPNSTWHMDIVTLTKSSSTVSASYVDQSAPDHAWGTTTLS
ncbi:MAG: hypothetical protein ACH36H_03585 [Candidatus Nanopelagicales bacterium]